jgi:hypothetical protein
VHGGAARRVDIVHLRSRQSAELEVSCRHLGINIITTTTITGAVVVVVVVVVAAVTRGRGRRFLSLLFCNTLLARLFVALEEWKREVEE